MAATGDIDVEEFRAAAHRAADWIADYLRDIETQRVLPDITPGAVRRSLPDHAPRRVYASAEAHSSVEKAAVVLGFGSRGLARVPVDAELRMDPAALERAIVDDRAGGVAPCAVVATAGTTASTSVDPVAAIADVCARQRLWLHVDAAYAGAAAAAPEYRWVLDGAERADSIVVNPHKWLFTPLDCSVLWTRRPQALRDAFALVP